MEIIEKEKNTIISYEDELDMDKYAERIKKIISRRDVISMTETITFAKTDTGFDLHNHSMELRNRDGRNKTVDLGRISDYIFGRIINNEHNNSDIYISELQRGDLFIFPNVTH